VRYLFYIFAVAAGGIVGLIVYDLTPSQSLMWGLLAGGVTAGLVLFASAMATRPEDSDPTIRPRNLPHDDGH
jgi:hypothetical protein